MHDKPVTPAQAPPSWLRLDNAAKIYPAIKRPNWSSVFRVSASLSGTIDTQRMQQALDQVLPRFAHLNVRIRHGVFWYYMDANPNRLMISEDASNPCMRMRWKENDGFLLRVRVYRSRVAAEFFHALTDGTGAMVFLKSLVAQYLRLGGVDIPEAEGILSPTTEFDPEELEDAYSRYVGPASSMVKRNEGSAWHMTGTAEPADTIHIITGIIPLDRLRAISKSYGASLTDFLVAVLMQTMLEKKQADDPLSGRPVRISVPVNCRNWFPSRTLRNFSLYVNPGVDAGLGHYTLEELIRRIHHYIRLNVDQKTLGAQMALNVGSERSPFLRPVPLFMKNFAMSIAYKQVGINQFSTTLSNLGLVAVPPAMQPYISRFDFMLGPALTNPVNCAVVGYDGRLIITFTRNIQQADIERSFFRKLVGLEIPVTIESNRP